MSVNEIQAKINQLENEARRLRQAEADNRQRTIRQREDDFIRTQGIHTGASDDYWTLTVGKHVPIYKEGTPLYAFYFGYEETSCPVHGVKCPDDADCDLYDWAFVARVRGQEVMRVPMAALAGVPDYENGDQMLLAGIAMFMRDHMLLKPEASPPQGESS